MATFVDLEGSRHQSSHSSSLSSSGSQLREFMKELARKPKLVVLDIGKTWTQILINLGGEASAVTVNRVYIAYNIYGELFPEGEITNLG